MPSATTGCGQLGLSLRLGCSNSPSTSHFSGETRTRQTLPFSSSRHDPPAGEEMSEHLPGGRFAIGLRPWRAQSAGEKTAWVVAAVEKAVDEDHAAVVVLHFLSEERFVGRELVAVFDVGRAAAGAVAAGREDFVAGDEHRRAVGRAVGRSFGRQGGGMPLRASTPTTAPCMNCTYCFTSSITAGAIEA